MKPRTAEAARLEADYLTRVKAAIAGREASEIDEIIESLRDHIEEELSELADERVSLVQMANVLEELGPPEAYAQEDGIQSVSYTTSSPKTDRSESTTDRNEPRRSKLAIAAALCVPAAIVLLALLSVIAGINNSETAPAAIACFAVLLTGMGLGMAALRDIRTAPRNQRGRGFAWFAIVSPLILFLWCLGSWIVYKNVEVERRQRAEAEAEARFEDALSAAKRAQTEAHEATIRAIRNHFTFDSGEGKSLIAQAASISKHDMDDVKHQKIGSLDGFKSQSLSAYFLTYKPRPNKDKTRAKRLAEEFSLQRDALAILQAMEDSPGDPSFLQPKHIQRITAEIQGDETKGTVEFEAPGVFKGKVEFVAKKKAGEWRIVKFLLPARGVALVLGDNGIWNESKIVDTSPGAPFDFESDEGKLLIARAASTSKEELAPLEKGGAVMELKDFKSHSLTVWFLAAYSPEPERLKTVKLVEEFEALGANFDPYKLFAALKDGPAPPSLLQPRRIRHVSADVQGDSARGTIEFTVLNMVRGKIDFIAKQKNGAWRIERFLLPVRGVAVVLEDDGIWRISKTDAK